MIYIEFCIWKSILNFLGVSYFWGDSPQIPTFSGFDPKCLERGPQYSARRRNFQKSQLTFAVLRIGYNPSQRNYTSFQYPRCPIQKTKKSAFFGRFGTVFNQMGGAPGFSRWDVILSAYPPVHTQDWKYSRGFLRNLPTGWDIETFLRAFRDIIIKISLFLGGGFGN